MKPTGYTPYLQQKYGANFAAGVLSTDKKSADEGPDPLAGQQLLQKNFSMTSISSQSQPFSTARLAGDLLQKTATVGTQQTGEAPRGLETESSKPEMGMDILPIKYTQPT